MRPIRTALLVSLAWTATLCAQLPQPYTQADVGTRKAPIGVKDDGNLSLLFTDREEEAAKMLQGKYISLTMRGDLSENSDGTWTMQSVPIGIRAGGGKNPLLVNLVLSKATAKRLKPVESVESLRACGLCLGVKDGVVRIEKCEILEVKRKAREP